MSIKWIGSAFLCTGLAFACGSSGGGFLSAGDRIEANINELCATAHECRDSFPPDLGFEFEDLFEATEADCNASFLEGADPDGVQESVDAGTVIYNAEDAEICADANAALSCAQFWGDEESPDVPECDTGFVGTIADGGACENSLECENLDAFCEEGVCTP